MARSTLDRDFDLARNLANYERRISALERRILTTQLIVPVIDWTPQGAAAGFTSTLEFSRVGDEVFVIGLLGTNTNWGAANANNTPVAVGGLPVEFRPDPESLVYSCATAAAVATTVFRVAIQTNGSISVRCSTATHTNSVYVNVSYRGTP